MADEGYVPPYTITDNIVGLVSEISEFVSIITLTKTLDLNPKLRRENRIKTIHSSLAIENNTLSLDHVTEIINGKRVLGPPSEIREVKNAYEAYNHLLEYNPYTIEDLLGAHKLLMMDLTKESGTFRTGSVGIYSDSRVVHVAPPAYMVHQLMSQLIDWISKADVHPLIKSCVFHYELEFIHPFSDGNGRMGRMWQTLLLYQWKEVFAWIPVESIIKERQALYYETLGKADRLADSSVFIEFLLLAIRDTLFELLSTEQDTEHVTEQVKRLLSVLGHKSMSVRELMAELDLKHRPSFLENYLYPAMQLGFVEMTIPDKPKSRNQRYKRVE